MNPRVPTRCGAIALAVGLAAAVGLSGPAGGPSSRPRSNLEYWLGQATTATAAIAEPARIPVAPAEQAGRPDAMPGVMVLSDGSILPGRIHTTRDKDLQVWVESQKRWRHVPPILLLSITAEVVFEGMEKEWRWKEMGSDEKLYTGRTKPIRRFRWRLHLIDDSYITGVIKGQPLWVEAGAKRRGPFVLHERSDGQYGRTLEELVYVKRVVISRRAMEAAQAASRPAR